jgi:hypothetical protein
MLKEDIERMEYLQTKLELTELESEDLDLLEVEYNNWVKEREEEFI